MSRESKGSVIASGYLTGISESELVVWLSSPTAINPETKTKPAVGYSAWLLPGILPIIFESLLQLFHVGVCFNLNHPHLVGTTASFPYNPFI